MKRVLDFQNLLRDRNLTKKVLVYFAERSYEDGYDPYENLPTYTNGNPLTFRAYVSQLSPTSLVWKGYGLKEEGSVELVCDKRFRNWLENANKIEIDGDEYQVFKEGSGRRSIITTVAFNLIKAILQRK